MRYAFDQQGEIASVVRSYFESMVGVEVGGIVYYSQPNSFLPSVKL
jgi:hypothetical protein